MKTPQMVILLAVVGCAAFAGGIVVERFLLTSGEYPDGESGRWGGEVGPQAPVIKESPSAASSRDLAESEEPAEADEDHSAPPPSTLEQFIDRLERGLVVDFTRAVAMIDRLPAGERRREFISRIASHWGHKDAPAALAWADELSGLERTRAIEHILHEWARIDPASASDYVARLPTSNRSLDWVHGVTRAWAEQDQAAAIAWGMAQQDPAVRRRADRQKLGHQRERVLLGLLALYPDIIGDVAEQVAQLGGEILLPSDALPRRIAAEQHSERSLLRTADQVLVNMRLRPQSIGREQTGSGEKSAAVDRSHGATQARSRIFAALSW